MAITRASGDALMRRNLQKHHQNLRNSELIFSIPLRRDFARRPAYWVEIYRTNHPAAKFNRYFMARQWGFVKKESGEKIQDDTVHDPVMNLGDALTKAKVALDAKIEAGWLKCDDQYDQSPPVLCPTKEEKSTIASYTADWDGDFDHTLKKMNIQKEDLPRSVKFKEAQKKRKAKAEW